MVAGVHEHGVKPGLVEVWGEAKHQRRVATPAVQDDHRRRMGFDWNEPAVQSSPGEALQPHFFFRQTEISRGPLCIALRGGGGGANACLRIRGVA